VERTLLRGRQDEKEVCIPLEHEHNAISVLWCCSFQLRSHPVSKALRVLKEEHSFLIIALYFISNYYVNSSALLILDVLVKQLHYQQLMTVGCDLLVVQVTSF